MHLIRLRGPWKSEWLDEQGLDNQELRQAVYTRTFHRPTGLDADQPVMLVMESVAAQAAEFTPSIQSIVLNNQALTCIRENPSDAKHSIAVTELLQAFNQLQLRVAFEPSKTPSPIPADADPPPCVDLLSISLAISE